MTSVSASPSASWRYSQAVAKLAQRKEGLAKVEAKIDRALELPARVRQSVQGRQSLLEAS